MLDLHTMVPGQWPDSGLATAEDVARLHEAWALLGALLCAESYWNVFAADLRNEPHGMSWGRGDEELRCAEWDGHVIAMGLRRGGYVIGDCRVVTT